MASRQLSYTSIRQGFISQNMPSVAHCNDSQHLKHALLHWLVCTTRNYKQSIKVHVKFFKQTRHSIAFHTRYARSSSSITGGNNALLLSCQNATRIQDLFQHNQHHNGCLFYVLSSEIQEGNEESNSPDTNILTKTGTLSYSNLSTFTGLVSPQYHLLI